MLCLDTELFAHFGCQILHPHVDFRDLHLRLIETILEQRERILPSPQTLLQFKKMSARIMVFLTFLQNLLGDAVQIASRIRNRGAHSCDFFSIIRDCAVICGEGCRVVLRRHVHFIF